MNRTAPHAVILLHGLGRRARSMAPLARCLGRAGFRVENLGYPSRHATVEALAAAHLEPLVQRLRCEGIETLHFVTHSMGGILLRAWCRRPPEVRIGRVVMLAPPNRGSEIVDRFRGHAWFRRLVGPAGLQLGTRPQELPRRLGPVDFELGVIAGTCPGLLSGLLPGPDDGKVSVRSTRIPGMKEHLAIHAGHTFLMARPDVQAHVLQFLRTGSFHSWG